MPNKFRLLYFGNKLQKHNKTPTSIDTLTPQLQEFCYVVSVSDKLNIFARFFEMFFTLIRNRNKVDAILIDTYSTFNFYYVFIISALARFFNIKYYPYLHGGNLPQRLENNKWMSDFIFKHSAVNIAPSGYLKKAFVLKGYKTIFIPNNIEISNYPFTKRHYIKPKFLYVRAFSKVYNPQLAVKVFKTIVEKYPKAKMLMVGPDKDGTFEQTKLLTKELNLEHSIEFTGKLSKEEWIKRSVEYDIFINPTSFDNQPVSIIEAMALGLIVVSTNVGGLPYLIENEVDGFLVNKDEVEMSNQILSILDKNLEYLSIQAREKALQYTWQNVSEQWQKIFYKDTSNDT